ncbi:MAG: ATP-binding protein [Clostridia bacterium]|nr:ATP-binding protein [Clostridia bacterium]
MKITRRKNITKQILKHKDVPVVKLITGIRRAGKTTLLENIKTELITSGVSEENIIKRAFSLFKNEDPLSTKQVFKELAEELENKSKCYLLLDEIQILPDWQDLALDLIDAFDADIYATTSYEISDTNLSKLKGRHAIIHVHPLSFAEFLEFKGIDKIDPSTKDIVMDYLKFGGFPLITKLCNNDQIIEAMQISEGIYSSIVSLTLNPIHMITSEESFGRVFKYISNNLGNNFSVNKISETLKSEKRSIAIETIYAYMDWLEEVFLTKRCYRYDLKTHTELKTQSKCYLADTSFYHEDPQSSNIKARIENTVFLELSRRGFKTHVGKFGKDEISFVGTKRNEKIYVQILDDNTPNTNSGIILTKINDHYPKYIITLDKTKTGNLSGIPIVHLADFLLENV